MLPLDKKAAQVGELVQLFIWVFALVGNELSKLSKLAYPLITLRVYDSK